VNDPLGLLDDDMPPGSWRPLGESEWILALESFAPVHQWGPGLLIEEPGASGLLRLWLRDDSGAGRHRLLRLDAATSVRARAGLARVEAAARQVADLLAAERERGQSSPEQLRNQQAASDDYVHLAETLYRELADSVPA